MIYDIHTHRHPTMPGEAIVQLSPDAFYPQTGQFYSVGVHPWDIRDDWRVQMGKLLVMSLHPQVVMIGETGMDKKKGYSPIALQLEVFREHVRLSELIRKPLVVHCVKGVDELFAVRKEMKATLPWVIHGFRGGMEQWRQLTRAGFYVSIGNCYDSSLVKEIPLTHLLLESDDSDDIGMVYERVGCSTGMDASLLAQHVASNIHRLLTTHGL